MWAMLAVQLFAVSGDRLNLNTLLLWSLSESLCAGLRGRVLCSDKRNI